MSVTPTAIFTLPSTERNRFRQLAFGAPVAIWSAAREDELSECFNRIEEFQRAGKYVVAAIPYEAARGFDIAQSAHSPGLLPLAWFAAFVSLLESNDAQDTFELSAPKVQTSETEYVSAVNKSLGHIRTGDIYQVNFTLRAQCEFSGSAIGAFNVLSRAVPVPYSAFVDTGAVKIVSLSPELFLKRKGSELISQPMKGTASRKPSWDADEAARLALEHSEKDRAENTMIVDLMRNDFGRVCKTGSVTVSELCKTLRYPTVHQMISTVRGELREGVSLFEIFQATFPPGSVTGAPKVRATEIIADLETTSRGIYCGSLGLFFPNGDFVCNVAIRTLEINGNVVTLGIGSGIVADSDPAREWEEVLLKAKFAERRPQQFALYEAFRWEPGVGYRNLHSHLRRLKHSCDYFSRPFPIKQILAVLRVMKTKLGDRPNRIRLDVNYDDVTYQLLPDELSWPREGVVVMIPNARLDPEDPRLYHKTTLRPEKTIAREQAKSHGAHECLFLNTRGEFTEGAISSILFKLNGQWFAPSLSCGLLPGVWRDQQIQSGRAKESVITFGELHKLEEIVIGNSVRGEARIVKVILENGQEVYRDRSRMA